MKAIWKDEVIAESDETVVVEGNHYFPKASVDSRFLRQSDATTVCGWKGVANYYDVVVGEETNPQAAWYYENPKDAAQEIQGRIAFWKGVQVGE